VKDHQTAEQNVKYTRTAKQFYVTDILQWRVLNTKLLLHNRKLYDSKFVPFGTNK